jgi:hypothetical protein
VRGRRIVEGQRVDVESLVPWEVEQKLTLKISASLLRKFAICKTDGIRPPE